MALHPNVLTSGRTLLATVSNAWAKVLDADQGRVYNRMSVCNGGANPVAVFVGTPAGDATDDPGVIVVPGNTSETFDLTIRSQPIYIKPGVDDSGAASVQIRLTRMYQAE